MGKAKASNLSTATEYEPVLGLFFGKPLLRERMERDPEGMVLTSKPIRVLPYMPTNVKIGLDVVEFRLDEPPPTTSTFTNTNNV